MSSLWYTDEDAVREILDVDPTIPSLEPFIAAAHSVINAHCEGLAPEIRQEVEKWLAAHFVCVRDPRAVSGTAKGVGETLQSRIDLGLNLSHYGQTAMLLDTTGGLAAWNTEVTEGKTKIPISMDWMGSKRS